jgi:deoxyribose-phosphate aldolase
MTTDLQGRGPYRAGLPGSDEPERRRHGRRHRRAVRACAVAHGPVAAVCVWPRFAPRRSPRCRQRSGRGGRELPRWRADIARALADVTEIVQAGARGRRRAALRALQAGDSTEACEFLSEAVREPAGLTLKVILETGRCSAERIAQATRLALAAGADFVKTSTGKTQVGATPQPRLLDIAEGRCKRPAAPASRPSGGVRTVADAVGYIALAEAALGAVALTSARLRIGASGLLNDIEACLRALNPPRHRGLLRRCLLKKSSAPSATASRSTRADRQLRRWPDATTPGAKRRPAPLAWPCS